MNSIESVIEELKTIPRLEMCKDTLQCIRRESRCICHFEVFLKKLEPFKENPHGLS